MNAEVWIVDAVRTRSGRGRPDGALAKVHPIDLLAGTLAALVERTGVDPGRIDDVVVGCVQQVGDQSGNIARNAVLAAGFPESVPGTTVNRQCGSSQQAVDFAAYTIAAGAQGLVVAAGVESMSRITLGSSRPADLGARLRDRYRDGLVHQGVSAELLAARWKLERAELDAFSAASHHKASAAWAAGAFWNEVIEVPGIHLGTDETLRPGTTTERLAELPPAFHDDAAAARFPEIEWRITAGNSSPISDGASAVLLAAPDRARALGLAPRARIRAASVVGDDPLLMLTGPVPATRAVLDRAGLDLRDIDVYEVNEAFAPVPLVWASELGADTERINVHGGAIALGHPLGASGTRLLTTLLGVLDAREGRYGLQTMCEAGGMANATIVERLA
ncbi:steroid 3-ketoacyl-CoA thiolase [Prauserella sp. PE36]|uniref:thiolase family protein n=1 Tax=Prauserella sp. PE36 TaxID=1504709 RepID=UPI000DE22B2F|nr:acetyl-CoA C-acyltransferase [Prauserella sp. PE36]RBM21705.1 steroid 3-ketoacyl-CoA thiolase [Prauserella sp. PE36]